MELGGRSVAFFGVSRVDCGAALPGVRRMMRFHARLWLVLACVEQVVLVAGIGLVAAAVRPVGLQQGGQWHKGLGSVLSVAVLVLQPGASWLQFGGCLDWGACLCVCE